MHNSQDNKSMLPGMVAAPNPTLLKADCAGCHTGGDNDGTGRDGVTPFAPQVDNGLLKNTLSGGYFKLGGLNAAEDSQQHNVADLLNNSDGLLGNLPPGGTTLATQLSCTKCHAGSGGHHGTNGGYRLLRAYGTGTPVTGTPDANYGVKAGGLGARSTNGYDATTMNGFCGSCHSKFHTNVNQETATGSGSWIRHPTDITLTAAISGGKAPSIVAYDGTNDAVPMGYIGAATDGVMCLSCHVPHGGPNADLLAFSYNGTDNVAGGGGASTGCESCHSYGGNGM
jgi:predicted CXXCH cytochrome family protein